MNLELGVGIIVSCGFLAIFLVLMASKLQDKFAGETLQRWANTNAYQITHKDVVATWEKEWWQDTPGRGQMLFRVKFTDRFQHPHLWIVKVGHALWGLSLDRVEVIRKQ